MTPSSNIRIAKNTLVLYMRMLFTIVVKLYTSRVVLQALGIDNYGIYNVVGGIVILFDFLNNCMTSSTQRYITYEIGKKDLVKINKVFITSINVHCIISLIIILLSETIGLYILICKLIIPENRLWTAFWVYQISVVTSVINIMSVPYSAIIIAHEKMNIFAYISIFEVIAKLLIAYVVAAIANIDKLILYAILIAAVQLIVRILYSAYCSRKIEGTSYKYWWNKRLLKEMLSFAGWNLIGNISGVLATQGQNIMLNMFFGPAVNAARAIAVQVQTTIFQFSAGFQSSINPQITKSYANSDLSRMHSLIYISSKFSFLALFILCTPFLLESPIILKLWLGKIPDYSVIFLRIILIISLVDCTANSLMISAAATGKIKKYQLVAGGIVLLICPITYIALKCGCLPYVAFLVHLIICIIVYFARLILLKSMILLNVKEFVNKVIFRCLIVCFTTIAIMMPIVFTVKTSGYMFPVLIAIVGAIIALISSFYLGLNRRERKFICDKIVFFYRKITNKC